MYQLAERQYVWQETECQGIKPAPFKVFDKKMGSNFSSKKDKIYKVTLLSISSKKTNPLNLSELVLI